MDISQNIVVPDKPDVLVSSSSVLGYKYDAQTYELFIWFRGGSIYRVLMVYPPTFSQMFDTGGSIGRKVQQTLKGLPHSRVR